MGPERLHDAFGLVLDRTHLGQARQFGVGGEELPDAPSRRGVEYDGVVRPCVLASPHRLRRLVDLSGEQDVAQAGSDRGRKFHHSEGFESLGGRTELEVRREVLAQCVLGIDVQGEDGSATTPIRRRRTQTPSDPHLGGAEITDPEDVGDALPTFYLTEQDLLASSRQGEGEGGRHR